MSRIAPFVVLSLGLAAAAHAAPPSIAHPMSAAAPVPVPNAVTCKMTYGGGPLMQHVKVFDVFYNTGNANATKLGDFYTAVTQSAHLDMLQEFNVTNFKIGRGSYIGKFEDANANPATIKSIDPQAYLQGLITAKKVPAPDNDTIYMLYFPPNIDPLFIDGTTHSCISARTYCAYHSSFQQGNVLVRFGVMPDVNANGCAGGCGQGQPFDNLTLVSSHELIEAVTDPDDNTAWVDRNNSCTPTGEIGDICATGGTSEVGTIGGFTVQKEWSNTLGACVVSNPNIVVNDFTVASAPATINVPQGGMATVTVTLTKVSGNAENVAITATAPTGLTAALSPASATSAGGTSMLTISAGPSAMIGMAKVSVKAAGTVITKTQDIAINVVPPADMAMAPTTTGTGGDGTGGNGTGTGNGTGGGNGNGTGGGNGNGASGNGASGGCSMGGAEISGGWALAALLLLAFAMRRRRA